ncbi:SMI1/KNR4 family protein [Saccharopolyspora sp. NPDC002376]
MAGALDDGGRPAVRIRDTCAVWKNKISRWTDAASFNPPAVTAALRDCERALGQRLPRELAELLLESDGVEGEYGLGLIWPVERIKNDNLAFRANPDFASLYMPFDPLLFFADAGTGDQFAFVMRDRPAEVFFWDHETDSRKWVAPSLGTYLEWWLGGRITL